MEADLWSFAEVHATDPARAKHLCRAPEWNAICAAVAMALREVLSFGQARFGMEELEDDPSSLRGIVQFPISAGLYDWFFNATTGYRAQFRMGAMHGHGENTRLVSQLLTVVAAAQTPACRVRVVSRSLRDLGPYGGSMEKFIYSFDPERSKVWFSSCRIQPMGEAEPIQFSVTGPKLVIPGLDNWATVSISDGESGEAWLDLKGAFFPRSDLDEPKCPYKRACDLHLCGSA